MMMKYVDEIGGLDRLATPDEVRIALGDSDDCDIKETHESSLEIPFDRGGYVRICAQEFEFLSLLEDVSRCAK
jgi:hypothetical protein